MGPTHGGNLFKYRHRPYGLRGERAQIHWNNLILIFNLKRILSLIYFKMKLWDSLPGQVRPPSFK